MIDAYQRYIGCMCVCDMCVSSHLEIRHEPCFGRNLSGVSGKRKKSDDGDKCSFVYPQKEIGVISI